MKKKDADLFARVEPEMLVALDKEAERIGETRSTIIRMLLREALQTRGHFTEPSANEAHGVIARRVQTRRTARGRPDR